VNQILWGNRYFKFKQKSLYCKRWVNDNIIFVKDIWDMEKNCLDEKKIYSALTNKADYFIQLSKLKQAISPFKSAWGLTKEDREMTDENYNALIKESKSKVFYASLIKQKRVQVINPETINWPKIYLTKYIMKDKKLSEFNLKLLNNPLPSNKNLFKWKLSTSPLCPECMATHDVKHLLFDCRNAKPFWNFFNHKLKIDIQWQDVVLCIENKPRYYNNIISLGAYIIYKYWLL
jgi:hypothetical protein